MQQLRLALAVLILLTSMSACANPVYERLEGPDVDISDELERINREAEADQRRIYEDIDDLGGHDDDQLPIVFP